VWFPDSSKLIKVMLHDDGADVETPWAEDLGPIDDRSDARRVRLANVLFLHAKPTYEDVIVVEREDDDDDDSHLAWNCRGVPFEQIHTRIAEDAGRWAMIVDYRPHDAGADVKALFTALEAKARAMDACLEGAFGPKGDRAGRAYLAVPRGLTPSEVMTRLRDADLALDLELVHPKDDDDDE
jgi:hypothetical protein